MLQTTEEAKTAVAPHQPEEGLDGSERQLVEQEEEEARQSAKARHRLEEEWDGTKTERKWQWAQHVEEQRRRMWQKASNLLLREKRTWLAERLPNDWMNWAGQRMVRQKTAERTM